jgi:low affinity Fe/Cu permease
VPSLSAHAPGQHQVPPKDEPVKAGDVYRKIAHRIADAVGAPPAFLVACTAIVVWLITGPAFGFSDTWQLVINTGTTIVTFLVVFLIQNSQNRDARAIHLKLDELLRGVKGARTSLVNLEALPDARLAELQQEFERLQEEYGVEAHQIQHAGHVLNERARRK